LASIWGKRFQQLREFKVQFGHCRVPQRYAANPKLGPWVSLKLSDYRLCKEGKPSPKLGQWVSGQRTSYEFYQEGKPIPMIEECMRALEGVGFDWGTDKNVLASIWSERFQQLREFNVQFGHCRVPQRYAANPVAFQRHHRWVNVSSSPQASDLSHRHSSIPSFRPQCSGIPYSFASHLFVWFGEGSTYG
jgi:hypothetical protein